jgi:hypothetical protein
MKKSWPTYARKLQKACSRGGAGREGEYALGRTLPTFLQQSLEMVLMDFPANFGAKLVLREQGCQPAPDLVGKSDVDTEEFGIRLSI